MTRQSLTTSGCVVGVLGFALAMASPRQSWVINKPVVTAIPGASQIADGVSCGGGDKCVLFRGDSGLFGNSASLLAYTTTDGTQKWISPKINGFGGDGNSGSGARSIIQAGNALCYSGSSCDDIDGHCSTSVTCIDSETGRTLWQAHPQRETVGGAGLDITPISTDSLLLVSANNAEPGSVNAPDTSSGSAWLALAIPTTGKIMFNKTFAGESIKISIPLSQDSSILVVVGPPSFDGHSNSNTSDSVTQDTAMMINLQSGKINWQVGLGTVGSSFNSGWYLVGPQSMQTLLHVTRKSATAIDIASGKSKWSSTALAAFGLLDNSLSPGSGATILNLVDGQDGNSNTLFAVSLVDGSTLWQFPPASAASESPNVEAFIWSFDCTADPQPSLKRIHATNTSAPQSGVCFLDYSCNSGSGNDAPCPTSLRIKGAQMCGGRGTSCRPALDLATGAGLYTLSVSGIPRDTPGHNTLFRYDSNVIFDGSSSTSPNGVPSLVSMDVRTGKIDWTVTCLACGEHLTSVTIQATSCQEGLANICGGAKTNGSQQCALCVGEHLQQLQSYGCTESSALAWCNHKKESYASDVRTVLLAGSASSLSGAPALLGIDPTTGTQLWTVGLTLSSQISALFAGSSWTIAPLWIDHSDTGSNFSVYLSGVKTDQALSSFKSSRRQRRQAPPPPPPTFYYFYGWRVDA